MIRIILALTVFSRVPSSVSWRPRYLKLGTLSISFPRIDIVGVICCPPLSSTSCVCGIEHPQFVRSFTDCVTDHFRFVDGYYHTKYSCYFIEYINHYLHRWHPISESTQSSAYSTSNRVKVFVSWLLVLFFLLPPPIRSPEKL